VNLDLKIIHIEKKLKDTEQKNEDLIKEHELDQEYSNKKLA